MVGDGWRWLGMVGSVSWDPLGGTDAARTREIETLADPGRPLACQRIPKRVPKSAPKGSLKGFQKGPPGGLENQSIFYQGAKTRLYKGCGNSFFLFVFLGGPQGELLGPFWGSPGGRFGSKGMSIWGPKGLPWGVPKRAPKPPPGDHPKLHTTKNGSQTRCIEAFWAPK